jgi:hypothetical protein
LIFIAAYIAAAGLIFRTAFPRFKTTRLSIWVALVGACSIDALVTNVAVAVCAAARRRKTLISVFYATATLLAVLAAIRLALHLAFGAARRSPAFVAAADRPIGTASFLATDDTNAVLRAAMFVSPAHADLTFWTAYRGT